jgi:hypothetical protein
MNCILKSCAHAKSTNCQSLGECGAAFALEMSKRNDGYLVIAHNNATIDALRAVGMITTKSVTGGYLIARAVQPRSTPYRYRNDTAGLARAAEIGSAR